MLAVRRRVQRLHATPGAEIEGRARWATDGRPGERHRRGAHAQHVVGRRSGDRASARSRVPPPSAPDHRAVAARSATRPRRRRPRRHRRSRPRRREPVRAPSAPKRSETGTPMTNSRSKVSSASAGTRRPVQRRELTAAQVRERVGPETFRERIEREPGVVQDAADPPRPSRDRRRSAPAPSCPILARRATNTRADVLHVRPCAERGNAISHVPRRRSADRLRRRGSFSEPEVAPCL